MVDGKPTPPTSTPLTRPHPAPLSRGGGVWSTAGDLLRWSQAMSADALSVSALLQTAGRLNDGRPVPVSPTVLNDSDASYGVI